MIGAGVFSLTTDFLPYTSLASCGLPAVAESVAVARGWVERHLADNGVGDDQSARAVLVLSELVTNVVREAREQTSFTVLLFVGSGRARLEVYGTPVDVHESRASSAPLETSLQAMCLLDAFADAWGHLPPEFGSGEFAELIWPPSRT